MAISEKSLKNLTNIAEQGLTPEQLRENGRKGGKKSGESRRAKRDMRQLVNDILEMNIKSGTPETFQNLAESQGKNINVSQALILAQVNKAMGGDTKAIEFLRDTAGMKPIDKTEITATMESKMKLDNIIEQLTKND